MIRAVFLQAGAAVIAALILGMVVGTQGAISAGLGGVVCIVPNAWFALRLTATSKSGKTGSYVPNFFVGEFIKVAATVGLLAIVIKLYPSVHWPSLLIGMVVALHASFFAMWKKS